MSDTSDTHAKLVADMTLIIEQDHGDTIGARSLKDHLVSFRDRLARTTETVSGHARPHFHKNEDGVLVKCYHNTKSLLTDYRFWIGMTIGYPLEHALWEKIPPFSYIGHFIFGH